MALTDIRKGELALAVLKQMSLEEDGAMSDSRASHLVEDLAGVCKGLPAELGASYVRYLISFTGSSLKQTGRFSTGG